MTINANKIVLSDLDCRQALLMFKMVLAMSDQLCKNDNYRL